MANRIIETYKDFNDVAHAGANHVLRNITESIACRGECRLVLAGGKTPLGLYNTLSRPPFKQSIEWSKVHIYWGDERCVPPDNSQSNYRSACEALLFKVPVPKGNIHRIKSEQYSDDAAALYEKDIREWAGSQTPRFDLILLGMGKDGHTASLFPCDTYIEDTQHLVIPTQGPKPPVDRVTMTLKTINSARKVIFLVTGEEKAETLKQVLSAESQPPAAMVQTEEEPVLWLIDERLERWLENNDNQQ